MLTPTATAETEALPAIPEVVKHLCNLGWIVVLGRDEQGQVVTQPTPQGLAIAQVLESQGTFEAISRKLQGWS